ncbi:acyl-CoA dehydrogenase [Halioglobus japonicus]|uniref:3-methylmercaptopropionyl-CoA dehydrogenase n=1 Tax=Halioglobus japonicus TaxID=930805 RepID=A0AAP8SM28_9GAMM|nr:acyl-CoA dehydrogenase C-terminal domain-containing protein [Halioglobus japonicus]AQA17212.1 acyl-CoA dehydrogenase [Halioglobus japonicus]PLW85127.1 acyl-CoA dehydrogenase [Halioglobus japonicus]GHD19584.1 acyl-CoA dehydrogenase [Halioglobus japonicus]
MPDYKAPLRDIGFVVNEVLEAEKVFQTLPGYEEASTDLMDAIAAEGAKFCEEVLQPLNRVGDEEGCTWSEEGVTTPAGFKEAYQQYVDNGWPSLSADVDYGGQGMPNLVGIVNTEMVGSANWSWGMYPGLSHGAVKTIEEHGTEEQKQKYLTKLISGEWTGTMCLTESHCGSDLGLLRTKAEPNADGSYAITGQKIFISAGEHDMTDNIVHIVLARLPDAPEGTKGISLFIVPKMNVNDDGSVGERNGVHCASIEHKMGIHGNATCVLNFDGAKGYLIGPENRGLNCMFTFMNTARIGTAAQGLSHMEQSFQGALTYAKERLAMRSLTGPKNADGPADPIIVHPDVRKMLLTQKAFAEGSRAFLLYLAMLGDIVDKGAEQEAKNADDLMSLLTPIAKAFMTETGYEAANHGVQIFGGHGFISEWGMEQIVRDCRIAMLYEGTTGIQAMDLIGRKVLGSGGKMLLNFTNMIDELCQANTAEEDKPFIDALNAKKDEWLGVSMQIGEAAMSNPDEAGSAAVDYLMYSGYITLAYFWAKMAIIARQKIAAADGDTSFYEAKLMTAQFYFERLLPRTESLKTTMLAGADNLMQMPEEMFAF